MKRINMFYLISFLFFIISTCYSLTQRKTILLSIIDSLFIVGISYVIIGALLYIFERGFFNGIVYALKRFRSSTKQGKFLSQFDDLDKTNDPHEEYGAERRFTITKPFLLLGSMAFVLSIALSYLLYT
ncbi:DUF3899 domain-containing protein [Rossellomorea aquimaris]|uniref:DUF3899 domain-containing protein n=1 Tax=Rossellomorea aquimaris TaxID=189382 RepID=UPI0007D0A4F2